MDNICSMRSDSLIYSCVICTLLSSLNYCDGSHRSQYEYTRCCWQEEACNINDCLGEDPDVSESAVGDIQMGYSLYFLYSPSIVAVAQNYL
jgi:hypothetical protein